MHTENKPYIAHTVVLPEITVKGVILGALLSMLLAGANAYLGLFAGLTVSASIPAAVVSMAVLGFFKRSNILENNIVQTAASAGEALACGAIFTLPALICMGYWQSFSYWETVLITASGGVLGVLFTIPLRSTLIIEQKLAFPEGVATAEVLKSGDRGGSEVRHLALAAAAGGIFKLMGSGAGVWKDVVSGALLVKEKLFIYFGANLSPALLSVGYIVGMNIAVLIFIGGAISWWIVLPAYIALHGAPAGIPAADIGSALWSGKIRFLGVGAMVVGGIWALVSIRSSLATVITDGARMLKNFGGERSTTIRTEKDMRFTWIVALTVVVLVPIGYIYVREIHSAPISIFMLVIMCVGGFLFAAVAGYMAGLVGSSNNPVSGVTVATILVSALLLSIFMGAHSAIGPASAILIGSVVACAASIAGDTMQDLKAGHVLGATPVKQQVMQIVGVLAASLVMGPVLNLLNVAYGFGPKTVSHPQSLAAPQATLMQSVAQGVFGGSLPMDMIMGGVVIGILIIIVDTILKRKNAAFRAPVLAVAVGLYLPFELDFVIMAGGVISLLAGKWRGAGDAASDTKAGILLASGLITGEAIMGILLAIPIVATGKPSALHVSVLSSAGWPGIALLSAIAVWLASASRSRSA